MPYITQIAVGKLEKLHVFGNDYATPDGTGVRNSNILELLELNRQKASFYILTFLLERYERVVVNG